MNIPHRCIHREHKQQRTISVQNEMEQQSRGKRVVGNCKEHKGRHRLYQELLLQQHKLGKKCSSFKSLYQMADGRFWLYILHNEFYLLCVIQDAVSC